ncbi:Hsp33 family molecular chaperone HslO [Spiroplasma culicicola]|uniref:Heat shock protein 33 n=1 Tax=Spiroplasma culicicola AES-1 TaxID=1276246 RepID=W6A689_9MOLU|nr:Hsp33 family molecular chaperone HslO [Spiroplasma culicicola]AHI52355.1 heat shock protein 33 [Spiroplasma culicicola AES-1]
MDMEIRAISDSKSVKMAIIDISESLNEIIKLQKTNPLTTVALGRTILANGLLSLSIKDGSKMTTNISGMGLGGSIIAEFQNNAVRGYIENPNFKIEEIDEAEGSALSQVVGKNGYLQVSRDNGTKEPYTSRVELISGEINMDFMYYLQQSDQVNSLITTTVELEDNGEIKKACGIIIQLLPGYKEEDIDFIEEKIGSLEHLKSTLVSSTNYESLLKDICDDAKILGVNELRFECTCTEEKVMDSIKMLGQEEIQKAYSDGEVVEVICDFCKKQYNIKPEQLKTLLN